MSTKKLLILGSTGTIGQNTLEVVSQHKDSFSVETLIANSNIAKLAMQAEKFHPKNVAIFDEKKYFELKMLLAHLPNINVVAGWSSIEGLLEEQYDITIAGIIGIACLKPLLKVLPNTRIVGLANKESIICAGQFLMEMSKFYQTKIIPVDSEHSAIYQLLENKNFDKVKKVTLTASGGPFYKKNITELQNIKVSDAVNHPIWKMGTKISVDSATLMNKGLELIEAHHLFSLAPTKLAAVIHPQALIHGFVEYSDGSTLAQISFPNMQTPIAFALGYPERLSISHTQLTWLQLSQMQFFEPDYNRFPCLGLAIEAMKSGQEKCIVLNIANERAVSLFLNGKISFLEISNFVTDALSMEIRMKVNSIEDVLDFVIYINSLLDSIPPL